MKKNVLMSIILSLSLLFTACSSTTNSSVEPKKEEVKVSENSNKNYPLTIKNYTFDKKENTLTIKEKPKKVITTNQTTTELLLYFGLEDSMIGTAYRDNPVLDNLKGKYDKIPVLSEKYPSKEVVIEKSPDLIMGWRSAFADKSLGSVESWNEKGINTFIQRNTGMSEKSTIDNLFKDIEDIGTIFDIKDKTDKYINESKAKIEKIQTAAKKAKEPVKVLVIEGTGDNKYSAYGNNSLAADIVEKAGGKNLSEKSGSLSAENIVSLNPDVIVLIYFDTQVKDNKEADALKNNEALKNVNAIKNNKIIYTPLADTYAGSMRSIDAIEKLAKDFYPDLIK